MSVIILQICSACQQVAVCSIKIFLRPMLQRSLTDGGSGGVRRAVHVNFFQGEDLPGSGAGGGDGGTSMGRWTGETWGCSSNGREVLKSWMCGDRCRRVLGAACRDGRGGPGELCPWWWWWWWQDGPEVARWQWMNLAFWIAPLQWHFAQVATSFDLSVQ